MPLNPTPLTFEGGRFGEAGYPLDALVELARYERLVVQVARGLWMDQHPGRQRAPRHFDESLRLRLVSVDEGSVVPVLERHESMEETNLFDPDDWLGKSQEVIAEAIASVANEQPLPEIFPDTGVSSLVQFGSSLLDEEICRFGDDGPGAVRYDQAARRHLIALTSSESIQIDGELLGRIGALNANKQTFDFTDRSGNHVAGAFSRRSLISEFRSVIDRDSDAPFLRLFCRYTSDEFGRLSGIEDVEELETLVGPQDPLGHPLRELLELTEGWHEGEGQRVDLAAIEWGIDFAAEVNAGEVTNLSVFPTLDGGLLLERQQEARRWSLEIEPAGLAFVTILTDGKTSDSEVQGVSEAVESYEAFIR